MKYLGIDFGTKRIGVAISDENGEFAFPKTIIPAGKGSIEAIKTLVVAEAIAVIVVGESLASNGVANSLLLQTKKFKETLEQATLVPVVFEREGYSTVEAHRYQPKAGSRDDSAAAIILQRYLDKITK